MDEQALKARILEILKSKTGRKYHRRELFAMLRERDLDYQTFKNILKHMEREGEILRPKGRQIALPEPGLTATGIFSAGRNGGGSVRLTTGETVVIGKRLTGDALTGDTVQVKLTHRRRVGFNPPGRIVKVIERSTAPVIGSIHSHGKAVYVEPRGNGFPQTVLVKNTDGLAFEDGDLVTCRFELAGTGVSRPMCTVIEVLGDPDAPGVDVLAILRRYQLPLDFPGEVITESETVPDDLGPEVIAARRDIRGVTTFTIDPEDARDFDDAISVARRPDGGWDLGVHIADVAHYVVPGSAMDTEAINRGMSCYLVDRVIPMLPERLSNDLCSLNPDVDRLTKSVFMTVGPDGKVTAAEAANTVIHSDMRLTYGQVQAYLDGDRADGILPAVGESLTIFKELAGKLIERRIERGAIDMELPEAKVILNGDGKPVDIVKRDRLMAHRMIEEAMVLANEAVATLLARTKAPFLYRIHDTPDMLKLSAFGEVASALGYTFNAKKGKDHHYIQTFLSTIQGTEYARMLNTMLLRSMKKAAYSPKNIGHYGLALEKYAHFTSPIRRYPDLVVHRQLDAFVLGNHDRADSGDDRGWSYYEHLGIHLTEREVVSDAAERDSIKMKAAEFMAGHLGEEYDGTITGVIPNGFFVELDGVFVEGLVHVSSLYDDYYETDRTGIRLVGRGSGNMFAIGDRLRVQVSSADKERGEIDLVIAGRIEKKKTKRR